MKIWVVAIDDLSHLGGRMGTEYTTSVSKKYFKTRKRASEYLKRCLGKHNNTNPEPYRPEQISYDCGNRGYDIYHINTEDE